MGRPLIRTPVERREIQRWAAARWYVASGKGKLHAAYRARRELYPLKYLLNLSRKRAKAEGREHTITEADLFPPVVCPVLGLPIRWDREGRAGPDSPSIDRIDNARGYVPGNVIIVSLRANSLKSDADRAELGRLDRFYNKELQQHGL